MPTELPLSSFSGVDDDARLAAFMTYAAAQTYKGTTVVLDEDRTYTFNNQQPLYSGFSIRGAIRPGDQNRSGHPSSNLIQVRTTGGWFYLNQAQTFACAFQGLTIDGTASNRLIEGHSSRVLWTSSFRDITSVNAAGVLGSSTQQLLMTACSGDGYWNINNVRNRGLALGGSDCRFNFSMCLLDSPTALLPDTAFLASFEYLSKTNLQNFYVTAEGHSAFSITGTGDFVSFVDCAIEGRNAGAPCKGSLIRLTGDTRVTVRDTWLAYAMSDPTATGRNDAGFVHATNGSVLLDGCVVEHASGVAESTPILYASGGKHIVRNMRAIGFTGKPVVKQTTAGLIDADSTVTVVTGP
ncbi:MULTISPECIES: hypothetical protein [Mumia]|uniref:hypothetical protein n=1 Tax=Mumia TaxID=1546255 RepID=UPI001422BACF|nr:MULTISPECIES: hypothetical protein [unclassified Mumia]QMW67124.1 hypothetical protein H4N58_04145 [Mumia sp. ZJ1417]